MSTTKQFFTIFLVFIFLFLFLSPFDIEGLQNKSPSFSLNGEIFRYIDKDIYGQNSPELICAYKNIFTKKIHIAILSFEKGVIEKIFDIPIGEQYYFFTIGAFESSDYNSILLFRESSIDIVRLKNGSYSIENYLNTKRNAFAYSFSSDFPYIKMSDDINKDGMEELFLVSSNQIDIYSQTKLIQTIPYSFQAFYDYKSSFGGFSSSQNIFLVFPDLIFKDINGDGFDDFILQYRTKIVYSIFNSKKNSFEIQNTLDLSKFVSIRSGYSFFNSYLLIFNFDNDKYPDILTLNFNMASVVNTDKTGILCYLFKGDGRGWQASPSNQFFIESLSGIESKLFFNDFNKDGKTDLISVGSKLFASNFFLSLSMKRALPIQISLYPQIADSFAKSPIIEIEKNISLDNPNLLESNQLTFDSYSTLDLEALISQIIFNNEKDLNKDGINDFVVYNFDGTFSIYLSNMKNPSIYSKKEDKIVTVSLEFLNIFYLSGPYSIILNNGNMFYLVNVLKKTGKIYLTPIN